MRKADEVQFEVVGDAEAALTDAFFDALAVALLSIQERKAPPVGEEQDCQEDTRS